MATGFKGVRVLFLLVPACLSAGGEASFVGSGSGVNCIGSLDSIRTSEGLVDDESVLRTYVLCPNTEFKLAEVLHQGKAFSEGQSPLLISKSNVRIQCGEDGSSSNNCVLTGGVYQLGFFRVDPSGNADYEAASTSTIEPLENVFVQGLTFHSSGTFNILIENEGDLTITDCVFQENQNLSTIFASTARSGRRLHQMLSDEVAEPVLVAELVKSRSPQAQREMQNSNSRLRLKVTNSLFLDNTLWSGSGASIDGLVSVDSGSVEIAHSVFAGTVMASDALLLGMVVFVENGGLNMRRNCFVGNDERIAPVVVDHAEVYAEGSFLHRRSAEVAPTGCEFISKVESGSLDESEFNQTDFACMVYSTTDVCTASIARNITTKMPCETSLDNIETSEESLVSTGLTRTYILCPETKYDIGSTPIAIGQPNTRILCGITGDSNNKCILSGGLVQLEVSDKFWTSVASPPAVNTLVQGVRFERATATNILIKYPGEILLVDCVFLENSNVASIYIGVPAGSPGNRRLDDHSRRTQIVNRENLKVSIDLSTFAENTVGSIAGQSTGIIINNGGDLSVKDTTFMFNEEVQVDPRFANYIIGNMNGYLELTGNCFVENKVNYAPVISHSDTFPSLSSNYGTKTMKETCEFAAVYNFKNTGTAAAVSQSNYYCMAYDRIACFRSPPLLAPRDPPLAPQNEEVDFESTAATATVSTNQILCGLSSLAVMFSPFW